MKNRRNYYRVLHVQSDAPTAVIKSSYCALMLKLKQHPDLGGDHETAALINEAHEVLTNSSKRAEYDRYIESRQSGANLGNAPFHRHTGNQPSPSPPTQGLHCLTPLHCAFCNAPYYGAPTPGMRCAHCESPLSPVIPVKLESADQRGIKRFECNGEVKLFTQHTHKTSQAWIQDLSPTGMCLIAKEPLTFNQVVKIDGAMLCAVARVVDCGNRHSLTAKLPMIGVEFLTLEFAKTCGTFVSQRI